MSACDECKKRRIVAETCARCKEQLCNLVDGVCFFEFVRDGEDKICWDCHYSKGGD